MSSVGKPGGFDVLRKQCAEACHCLSKTNPWLEDAPKKTGHALWEWDVKAELMSFSPGWRAILRQPRDSSLVYTYSNWHSKVHEEDLQELQDAAKEILAGRGETVEFLFRIQREDGCWAWLFIRGAVTEHKNGLPVRLSGVVVDVSSLRTNAKFQHGQSGVGDAAYHAMLENSPDLVVRMDRELFPLYINPVVARYMARESHEYSYSESLEELSIEPRQLEFLKRNVSRVFDEKLSIREMVSFTNAFGEEVTGEYSFWPEFDSQGQVTFVMTQFRDLTEQVLAEERARLNERRLDALYRLTSMGDAPEEEIMRFVMNSLIQLTGSNSGFIFIPDDDVNGPGRMLWSDNHYSLVDESYLPKDRFPQELRYLTAGNGGMRSYRSMSNGDGVVPVRVAFGGKMNIMRTIVAPGMEDGRVVCLAGVCNKLTDYKDDDLQQLEMFINGAWLVLRRHSYIQELKQAKEAAEHANKVKDEFLANVSHELRTPLNGLLSMLQLLAFLPLTEQQREYVTTANLSGKALLRIISDILDYSRIESGTMDLRSEPFDLKQTLASTVNLFRGEADNRGLSFHLSIDDSIPSELLGDDARVRQIIFNVLGNALKFTERGGISVHCLLEKQDRNDIAQVLLSIQDTGIGIPQALQSVIFEAFTQLGTTSTKKYSGTGLGLGIVRRLVDMMQGDVWIESEVGLGTTVHCRLCFPLSNGDMRKAREKRASLHDKPLQPLDILVAEDDNVGRFAMRAFLMRMGHRPVCVANGRQAIEALKIYPFHCLFTDIQMPDMDGMELARRIRGNATEDIHISELSRSVIRSVFPEQAEDTRQIGADIAIVAISAHAMAGDKERFLEAGMDYYISKPIVIEELADTLHKVSARLFPLSE